MGVVMTGGAKAVCGAAGIVGGGSCEVTICGLTTFGVNIIAAENRSSNVSAGFASCSFTGGDLMAWPIPRANPSAPAQRMTFIIRGRISVSPALHLGCGISLFGKFFGQFADKRVHVITMHKAPISAYEGQRPYCF